MKQKSLILILLPLLLFAATDIAAQQDVNEQLALQYYQQGEFAKAADLYKEIYKKKPNTFYYNNYLNSLFGMHDYAAAENFVKSVIKKHPGELNYQVELGYVYELAGNNKKATKIYKKTIKKISDTRDAYVKVSGAFQNRGHYDYALDILNKGKNKFDPPLNLEIADLYFSKGDYNKMIDSYLDMIHNSDEYLNLVKGKLQLIMATPGSNKVSEALREELLKRTEKYPSKTIYAELLYWYSVQKREFALALIQAKSLDRQFNEGGERVFQLSNILISNGEYEKAIEGLSYILSLGKNNRFYQSAEISLLHVRFLNLKKRGSLDKKSLNNLVNDYQTVLSKYGEKGSTAKLMRNLAQIQAFYLHNTEAAEKLLNKVLTFNNLSDNERASAKLELGDVLLFEGKKWSAGLIYKQVEKEFKNDPIGYEAKFKAAKFYYYVGEMEWAKVQLDVLKGATSKLIANDAMELSLLIAENIDPDSSYTSLSYFSRAELLAWQKKYTQAFAVLDSIDSLFPNYPILPYAEFKRAEIYLELKEYNKATDCFKTVADKYPYSSIADNALIKLARIYDFILNDKTEAKNFYEKLLLDYPGSLFTIEARERFNKL